MSRLDRRRAAFILAVGGGIALGFGLKTVVADGIPSPNPLYYAGTLIENKTLVDGPRIITIDIWPDATTSLTPLCHTTAGPTVVNGRFRMQLDASCKAAINAHPNAYVEVVDGSVSLGRSPIGAVAYAVEADHATTATTANNAASATTATSALNFVDGGGIGTSIAALQSQLHPASGFRAWTNFPMMIRSNEQQTVPFDQVDFDLGGEYSAGVFTPKYPGIYLVSCSFEFSVSSPGDFAASIHQNDAQIGTTEYSFSTTVVNNISPIYTSVVQLFAGDQLTCAAYQSTGTQQPLYSGYTGRNMFTAIRLN